MSTLTINGTRLLLDGHPFYYQGLSFFNALYNPTFNDNDDMRRQWLAKFKSWGITALRVWGDWRVTNHWVDEGPDRSLWIYPGRQRRNVLYEPEGALNVDAVARLKRLLTVADELHVVVEIALFTHYLVYPVRTRDEYLERITRELKPWRNVIFQVWNEYDDHTLRHYETIKLLDADRLVTNSPGGSDVLGSSQENQVLDLLSPHTFRSGPKGRFWEIAPEQIKWLMETYAKPVLDDEPARTGTADFGGNPDSQVEQHLIHINKVHEYGGYHNYHHDMFQLPYGAPATPPSGIPDPEFSPFHRRLFERLRELAPQEAKNL